MNSKQTWILTALLTAMTAFRVCAYEVTIGVSSVSPGNSVQVPVLLDDAANVATVQFQVNYDPQILTLTGVTNRPGTLGSNFGLSYENDDGVVVVILYRQNGLVSGSGELASLTFSANSGAEVSMESALTLAEAELGSQTGKDLSWTSPVSVANGLVQIQADGAADSDSDGIPDSWEEQYFGSTTNANPNAICANGINTVKEAHIAGLDPNDPHSRLEAFLLSGDILDWNSVSGRVYSVYWTTNLLNGFQCLESNIPWTRCSITNQSDEPCGYYRLEVQLAP
jgi:hypothetical protein